MAMFDLLGLCKFLGFHCLPPGIKFSYFRQLIKTAYGKDFTEGELKTIGERLINIERRYLVREGLGRDDDYPPPKTFLPLKEKDGVREEDRDTVLDRKKYDAMLDEYYDKRGWTKDGKIKPETIRRLHLDQEIVI